MIGILCREKRLEVLEMEKALKENNIGCKIILLDEIELPFKEKLDYVLVRGGPGIKTTDDWDFLLSIIKDMENNGIKCINSSYAIENGMNKFFSYELFHKNNIPTPETHLYNDVPLIKKFPVVSKPIVGSEGQGVEKIEKQEDFYKVKYRPILIQEFLSHNGVDYRAYVVGDKVLGAIKRTAKDSWITNLAKGGIPDSYDISEQEKEVVLRAVKSVKAELATVDFVSLDQVYILEVNVLPIFSPRLEELTGFNFPREIVKYFLGRYM